MGSVAHARPQMAGSCGSVVRTRGHRLSVQSVGSSARMLMQDLGLNTPSSACCAAPIVARRRRCVSGGAVGRRASVAGAALLVTGVPLSVSFAFLSNPERRAAPAHDAALRAAS
jgi:uncharacterized ferredoxin-like protein